MPLRPKPSFRGCSNAASRFGPTLPLVWARPSTWQEPHLATNICLPAMRLGLPPSVRVEQALSTTAHAPTTAIATAARRRLMDRTGPIGARLYPLRRTRDYDGAVTLASDDWEGRNAALWEALDSLGPDEFTARMERLAAELPEGDAVGLFERGAAFDSTGSPDRAVPLYEAALAAGLEGNRRRRAVIQMASSIRNLGDPGRALELLRAEAERPPDGLDDAVATF